jgi:dolichol-phosphate mannosyltransferase
MDTEPTQLSIIVPTFNERQNVVELIRRVDSALPSIRWEVIFVDDDSPDGTAALLREIARVDSRVRVIERIGRRGLSAACIEGVMASCGPMVAVMDADLQHDEAALCAMYEALRRPEIDLVIASRYVSGGDIGTWDLRRALMSRLATRVAQAVMRQHVSDPMSGYFMLRREVFHEAVRGLSARGFKILVDILATLRRPLRIVEIPYSFRARIQGESKLDSIAIWDFGMLLADKTVGRFVPVRFLGFAIVGALGVAVHMTVLALALKLLNIPFAVAQASAAGTAMVFNFAVNNLLTYRDHRLRGTKWWLGLASFVLACSIGAVSNVGVAAYLFGRHAQWPLAALAGVLVGSVWNYAVTRLYTWGNPRSRHHRNQNAANTS